ncbi:hypothetical protein QVD17_31347 [Tagetes erecta]|uniref:Transposase-associated domain-containing protein n=1 Tax=Tagetes erecta TaxID=13708 RepID=A0AAD8NNF9_TARER|nr:hypothetical protein QVD17_31347 [Tagetes erecta]
MSLDKSWLSNPNRRSPEYQQGIDSFVEMAKEHVDKDGNIRCPCTRCYNSVLIPWVKMDYHLQIWGICRTYKDWIYHGESLIPEVVVVDEVMVTNDMVGVIEDVMDECIEESNSAQIDTLFQDPIFMARLSQFMDSKKASAHGDEDDMDAGDD